MSGHNGVTLKNMTYNGMKVKKWFHNGARVFSAGSTVTYVVDSGVSYTEEVDSGASCLSPKTFTPSKSGWSFLGWREDTAANSSVLSSKVMGDAPITLYAVYSKSVTLSYNGNGSTDGSVSAQSGTAYCNYKGDVVGASFTLKNNGFTRLDYSFSKWDLGAVGASVTLNDSKTAYAQWTQVSLTLFDGGTFYHDFDILQNGGEVNSDEGHYANWNKNNGLYLGVHAYYRRLAYVTTTKIDVTNLKTLNFTISGVTKNGGGLWMIGLQNTRSSGESWSSITVKHNGGKGSDITNGQTLSLDVSNLSGSYYVIIQVDPENRGTLCFTATKGWFTA